MNPFSASGEKFMLRYYPIFVILLGSCFTFISGALVTIPKYREFYFQSLKNPFSFTNDEDSTFKQRYLVCDEFVKTNPEGKVNLFVYTGNEGDIEVFYNNTGLIFTFADDMNALVVFIEYRYYGKSYVDDSYQFLSADLAMYDFATIIRSLVAQYSIDGKVILFGGSYGGMLASWMRMKYPDLVYGVLASSAPNLHFSGLCDEFRFGKIITDSFGKVGGVECVEFVRNGFLSLHDIAIMKKNFSFLNENFKPCVPIRELDVAENVIKIVEGALEMLACVNYPYESTFAHPLPAHPVKYTCSRLLDSWKNRNVVDPAKLYEILNVYYNYSGRKVCFDYEKERKAIISDRRWFFERCTDIILPVSYNGKTDFFLPYDWRDNFISKECGKEFHNNFVANLDWMRLDTHGDKVKYTSRIIFSNGELDPWGDCGVYDKNIYSDTVYSIVIKDAAHHLDLKFANENDPHSVIEAREREKEIIQKWIDE